MATRCQIVVRSTMLSVGTTAREEMHAGGSDEERDGKRIHSNSEALTNSKEADKRGKRENAPAAAQRQRHVQHVPTRLVCGHFHE